MVMFPVNYVAVLVAAIANFFIGFLMHGPVAGKMWMKLANIKPTGKEKFSDMVPQMVKNFFVNLIFAYFLALVILFVASSPYGWGGGAINGILCAIAVWLGFLVTTSAIDVIWMGKSSKLWAFEAFSSLLCCIAMGAIIGGW